MNPEQKRKLRLIRLNIILSIFLTIIMGCLWRDIVRNDYIYVIVDSLLLFFDLWVLRLTYNETKEEIVVVE